MEDEETGLMGVDALAPALRTKDVFHHVDPGFVNRRLCMTALPRDVRAWCLDHVKPGDDHFVTLRNDHLLVTVLFDVCDRLKVPTLVEILS